MALDMTPEQREIGKANFQRAVGGLAQEPAAAPGGARPGMTRRGFMKGLIGAGDEGGVLVGEHNPEFLEFIAYSDIRPTNQKRIFTGDDLSRSPNSPRKGFNRIYGSNASRQIRLYEDYHDLL